MLETSAVDRSTLLIPQSSGDFLREVGRAEMANLDPRDRGLGDSEGVLIKAG